MIKSYKPWYIWFSIPALLLLWGDTSRRIKVLKDNNLERWTKACWNLCKISVLVIVLPLFISGHLISIITGDMVAEPLMQEIIASILLIQLYFQGVISAHRHAAWRKKISLT